MKDLRPFYERILHEDNFQASTMKHHEIKIRQQLVFDGPALLHNGQLIDTTVEYRGQNKQGTVRIPVANLRGQLDAQVNTFSF